MATAEVLEPPAPRPALPARLIRDNEIAELFGVTQQTVRQWCRKGRLPAPIRMGKSRFWRPEVLAAALDGQNDVK